MNAFRASGRKSTSIASKVINDLIGCKKVTNDLIGCKKVTNDLIGCKKVTNDLIGCKKVTNDLIGCKKVTNDLIGCETEGQQSVVVAQNDSSFKEAGKKRRRNEKKLNSSQEFKKTIIVQTENNKQTSSQVSNTNGEQMKAVNAKSLKEKQLPSATSLSRKRHRLDSDDETNDEESPHKNRRVVPVERIKKVAIRPSVTLGKAELSSYGKYKEMKRKNKFGTYMELLCLMMDMKCRL